MTNRIEFYKNRGIGERFSVAIDFLKQNWKVLYKNILLLGLPLAIIMGYFLARQTDAQALTDLPNLFLYYGIFMIISITNMIYMYSMTGAVLHHYECGQLTESTGWNSLKDTFFKFSGKTTLIILVVYIPIIIIVAIFAAIFGVSVTAFSSEGPQAISILLLIFFILLLLGGIIALAPSFIMLFFPSYFSKKTIWESIKASIVLGFKNWGSLFVAIILVGIVITVASLVFNMPFQIMSIFTTIRGGGINIFSYILAIFSTTGTMLTTPIMIIIFAFQYFSIVEKEEGISLKSQLDEFENL